MSDEELIKRKIKKLKKIHPGLDEEQLRRELIPLSGDEIDIKTAKKRRKL